MYSESGIEGEAVSTCFSHRPSQALHMGLAFVHVESLLQVFGLAYAEFPRGDTSYLVDMVNRIYSEAVVFAFFASLVGVTMAEGSLGLLRLPLGRPFLLGAGLLACWVRSGDCWGVPAAGAACLA